MDVSLSDFSKASEPLRQELFDPRPADLLASIVEKHPGSAKIVEKTQESQYHPFKVAENNTELHS